MAKLSIDSQPMDTVIGTTKVKEMSKGWFNDCSTPTANEISFIVQVLIIFIVVIASIVNLSLQNGDSNLWTALLSCFVGYVLPNPKLKSSTAVTSSS